MIPKSMLLHAQEGDTDAQDMLADYLKEAGYPDHIAEESYIGAIHPNHFYHRGGSGGGLGTRYGNGGGREGASRGRGSGNGTGYGWGGGLGSRQGRCGSL